MEGLSQSGGKRKRPDFLGQGRNARRPLPPPSSRGRSAGSPVDGRTRRSRASCPRIDAPRRATTRRGPTSDRRALTQIRSMPFSYDVIRFDRKIGNWRSRAAFIGNADLNPHLLVRAAGLDPDKVHHYVKAEHAVRS
jgi:hypothetical protein